MNRKILFIKQFNNKLIKYWQILISQISNPTFYFYLYFYKFQVIINTFTNTYNVLYKQLSYNIIIMSKEHHNKSLYTTTNNNNSNSIISYKQPIIKRKPIKIASKLKNRRIAKFKNKQQQLIDSLNNGATKYINRTTNSNIANISNSNNISRISRNINSPKTRIPHHQNLSILQANVSAIQGSSFISNKQDGSMDSMDQIIIGVGLDGKSFEDQNQIEQESSKSSKLIVNEQIDDIKQQYELLFDRRKLLGVSNDEQENMQVQIMEGQYKQFKQQDVDYFVQQQLEQQGQEQLNYYEQPQQQQQQQQYQHQQDLQLPSPYTIQPKNKIIPKKHILLKQLQKIKLKIQQYKQYRQYRQYKQYKQHRSSKKQQQQQDISNNSIKLLLLGGNLSEIHQQCDTNVDRRYNNSINQNMLLSSNNGNNRNHKSNSNHNKRSSDVEDKEEDEEEKDFYDFVTQPDPQNIDINAHKQQKNKSSFSRENQQNLQNIQNGQEWPSQVPMLEKLEKEIMQDTNFCSHIKANHTRGKAKKKQIQNYLPILEGLNQKESEEQQEYPKNKQIQPNTNAYTILQLREQWIKDTTNKSNKWKQNELSQINKFRNILNNYKYDDDFSGSQ